MIQIFNYAKYVRNLDKGTRRSHSLLKSYSKLLGSDILEYSGKFFIVALDFSIKFKEIKDKTADTVALSLTEIFTQNRLSLEIIADNNPFTSQKTIKFCKQWGCKLTNSCPQWPNSMSKFAVRVTKVLLKNFAGVVDIKRHFIWQLHLIGFNDLGYHFYQ